MFIKLNHNQAIAAPAQTPRVSDSDVTQFYVQDTGDQEFFCNCFRGNVFMNEDHQ